jgi:hypothetical protein
MARKLRKPRPRPPKPVHRPSEPRIKLKTLRQISREGLRDEDETAWRAELDNASDRSTAIIGGLLVEDYLAGELLAHLNRTDNDTLNDLFGRDGPLSTFYSLTQLAYAMAIIDDETMNALNIVRQVRNAFAHAIRPLTFNTPEVFRECQKLAKRYDITLTPDNVREAFISMCFWLAAAAQNPESKAHPPAR